MGVSVLQTITQEIHIQIYYIKPPHIRLSEKLGKNITMQEFSKRNRSISNTKMFSAMMAWKLQCVLLVLLCAAESTYSGKVC